MRKRPMSWYVDLTSVCLVAATAVILLIGLHGAADVMRAIATVATIAAATLLISLVFLKPRSTPTLFQHLSTTRLLPFLAILVVALHVALLLLSQRTESPPARMPMHVSARLGYGAFGAVLLGLSAILLVWGLNQLARGSRARGSTAVGLAFVIQLLDPVLLRLEPDISVDPEPFVSAAIEYLGRDQPSKAALRETLTSELWYTDKSLRVEAAGESGVFPFSEYRIVDCGSLAASAQYQTAAMILVGGVDPVGVKGGQTGFPANNAELGLARAKNARDECLKEVPEQVPIFLLSGAPGTRTVTAYSLLISDNRTRLTAAGNAYDASAAR